MAQGKVVGVHPIPAEEPVYLIEMEIEGDPDDFDLDKVTQEVPGTPRSDWQAPYDERQTTGNRIAFFFHFLDLDKPLLGPAGPLTLPQLTPVPEHLQEVEYEQP